MKIFKNILRVIFAIGLLVLMIYMINTLIAMQITMDEFIDTLLRVIVSIILALGIRLFIDWLFDD